MATATSESKNASDHVVELIVRDASAPSSEESDSEDKDQIAPLLSQERPKINIFTASYPRTKPRAEVTRLLESETSPFTNFILWVWNGSRYSGLLCMAFSSTIYFLMGVLTNIFSVQAIPLFETAFTRCAITLILSYLWLRWSEQPVFGTSQVRIILLLRALTGCISMSSFIYCSQRLPFSQAIVLNSTVPIMASIMARVFLHDKLKVADIASLACCFFGVLFFFREALATEGYFVKAKEASNAHAKTASLSARCTAMVVSISSSLVLWLSSPFHKVGLLLVYYTAPCRRKGILLWEGGLLQLQCLGEEGKVNCLFIWLIC
ncbi:uncharacterized protein LOC106765003 isoform X5 [Vigna radiata var. radiata]|uniref:Uncharacterized protein LOC106765003 isoform X5 n=1 Tax=Vigna radiata var. radiata TaxID=3916 RepID=A0A3Q0F647_VIGRR|nr:uncharacterized protein LOC106765003 isoform X5 [Vigna radiata var. radiata]